MSTPTVIELDAIVPVQQPIVDQESTELISSKIQELNSLLQNKNIGQVKYTATNEKKCISIDSLDGKQRTIIETITLPGLVTNSIIQSVRLPKESRLETVKRLHMEGKRQRQIADIVCVSQRTVSEDLKTLRRKGEIR